MKKDTYTAIINNVKNLISYSIENRDFDHSKFEELHCAILKQYFDARNIKINYERKSIDLQLPINNSNYTTITFEFLDLKGFLQACLKQDNKSMDYYQGLLSRYESVHAA